MMTVTPPTFTPDFRDSLHRLFAWRRDNRHFRTAPVEQALIDHLLDMACLSPSVGNSQPWRFVQIVSSARRAEIIAHVEGQVREAGDIYAAQQRQDYSRLKLHGLQQAPVWIAAYCDDTGPAGRGLGRQTMPETLRYSVVMAIHSLWLAARAHGLGMGWVSILQPERLAGILEVPDQWGLVGLLCLGWPESSELVPELEREGWQARLPAAQLRLVR